jgi:protein-S-isoprenylcysteine O-methyltransferase Ste14
MRNRTLIIRLLILVLLGIVLVSHHPFAEDSFLDDTLELSGYLLLVTAAIGRLWCAAYISGNKKTQLVVSGPYSLVRNPLYFFSLLGFIGAGFALESITVAITLAVVFTLTHVPAMRAEENNLQNLFGGEFTNYMETVPRFFPRSLTMTQPDRLEFSPRLFNRAVWECAMILLIFLLAHGLEWTHEHGIVPVLIHLP